MHEVLVNHFGDLSLHRKCVLGLTECPDMTLAICHGHKTTTQQQNTGTSEFPGLAPFCDSMQTSET